MSYPGGALGRENPPANAQCRRHRRHGFIPWVRKIPWRRERQPAPVFLAGECPGQRNLVSYSRWGYKESDTTEQLSLEPYRLPMIAAFRLIMGAKVIKIIKI